MIKCLPMNLLNRLIAKGIIELCGGTYRYMFPFGDFLALSSGLRIISYTKAEILSLYRVLDKEFEFIQGPTEWIDFESEQAAYDYIVGVYHDFMKQYYKIINNETITAINNLS